MVTQETRDALAALDAQIKAAEKNLKRLPGSRHEGCAVRIG